VLIWEQLTHWEQKRLRKYLASPYFNTDPRMQQLLDVLAEGKPLSEEKLFAQLEPESPYTPQALSNLLSYFKTHVEGFLAQEGLRKQPFPLAYARLQMARERGFQRLFDKEIRNQARQNHAGRDLAAFWKQYQLAGELDQQSLSRRQPQSAYLRQQLESLSSFHSLALLKGACQWANRKQVVQSDVEDAEVLDGYITAGLALDFDNEVLFLHSLYQEVLKMLVMDQHGDAYQTFSSLLKEKVDTLSPEDVKALCQYGQNYCIRQINQGNPAFLSDLFDWYQQLLTRDLLYYQGYLQDADVKNLVSLGVRLEKFEWAESFFETYQEKIAPTNREGVIAYNRAYLHHAQGKLRSALRLLREVDLPDVYYELGGQTLLAKIYYELVDHEGLDAQLHAFEQRLRRNRFISVYQRKGHLNLIRFLRRLDNFRIRRITLAPRQQLHQLALLKKRLDETPGVINISWLRAQLAQLEEKSH